MRWKDSWAKRWHEWRLVRRSRGQDTMQGAASPLTRRGPDLFPCIHGPRCSIVRGKGEEGLFLSLSLDVVPSPRATPTRDAKRWVLFFGISPLREYGDGQVKASRVTWLALLSLSLCFSACKVLRVTGFDETEESGIAGERPTFYGCKRWSCLARDERRGLDTVESGGLGF